MATPAGSNSKQAASLGHWLQRQSVTLQQRQTVGPTLTPPEQACRRPRPQPCLSQDPSHLQAQGAPMEGLRLRGPVRGLQGQAPGL